MRKNHRRIWYRDDKNRSLATDIEWAMFRFSQKEGQEATKLIIPISEQELFSEATNLELIMSKDMPIDYFGLR